MEDPTFYNCTISESIVDDKAFRIFLFLELLVAILAFFFNALVLCVIHHVSVFHINLRFILAYMSLNLLLYSAACAVKEIITIYRLFDYGNYMEDCRMVTKAFECKLQEMTNTIPIGNVVYTSLVLCVERFYSTLRYRRYDLDPNRPWLALGLLIASSALVLWSQLNGLLKIPHEKTVPICESLISMNERGAVQVLVMNLTAEVLTIAMALHLYFWNNYKLKLAAANRAQHTLSSRFQISQNVKINSLILPSVIFQSFCYIPNYLFLLIVIIGIPFSECTKTWLLHANYLWKEVYALAHPLLALKRNVHIMEQLEKRCPKMIVKAFRIHRANGQVVPIGMVSSSSRRIVVSPSEMHFEVLDRIWTKQQKQQRRGGPCPSDKF